MDVGGYGSAATGPALVASQAAEIISLTFLALSLVLLAFLSARVNTVKSFQFETFIFALVVSLAEIPRILGTLGYVQTSGSEVFGLILHTASMVFLSGFIMIRVLKYFTEGK